MAQNNLLRICIIGGGISGLSAAYYLLKAAEAAGTKLKLTLIEKEKRLGGITTTHQLNNFSVETTYHLFFPHDNGFIALIGELGLLPDFKWFSTKGFSYLHEKGKSYLSGPKDVLLSRELSLLDKFALARIYIEMKLRKDWRSLDNISAKKWLLTKGTSRLYRFFFEPLLSIKWGEAKEQVSAAWLWGRINPRSRTRDVSGGGEKMAYILGSLERLSQRLTEEIRAMGGELFTGTELESINFEEEGIGSIDVKTASGRMRLKADLFISTIPPEIITSVSPGLPRALSALRSTKYAKIVCMTFALKRPLIDTLQMPIAKQGFTAGGVFELTNCVPPEHFGGMHITYLFNYLDSSSRLFDKSEAELRRLYIGDMKRINPSLAEEDIIDSKLYKNRYGTPIYTTDYLKNLPPRRWGNLWLHGMVHAYPVSDMNHLILNSKKLAKSIIGR
jgi:protoporphyrinogen oxidase